MAGKDFQIITLLTMIQKKHNSILDFQPRKSVETNSAKAANGAQFSSMDR